MSYDRPPLYSQLETMAKEYAAAESDRVYLTEFRKCKKAILMKEAHVANSKLSAAAQEREAYAHPDYIELLVGIKEATEKALYIKFKLQAINMEFDAWRTKQSTRRAEMNIL